MRVVGLFLLLFSLSPEAVAQWTWAGPGRIDKAAFETGGGATFAVASVGRGSLLYRSEDGGRSWADVTAGLDTENSLEGYFIKAVSAVDGLVVVMTTRNGGPSALNRVYTSTDRGNTWTFRTEYPESEVEEIVAVDAQTIMTYRRIQNVNAQPIIKASTDGGATWMDQTPDPATFTGFFTGDIESAGGAVLLPRSAQNSSGTLASRDAGATWTFTPHIPSAGGVTWTEGDRYYRFSAPTSVPQTGGRFFWTDDGGQTWSQREVAFPGGAQCTGCTTSIRSSGDTLVYVRPPNNNGPALVEYSYDFGATWGVGDPDETVARGTIYVAGGPAPVVHATGDGFLYAYPWTGSRIYRSQTAEVWADTGIYGFQNALQRVLPFGDSLYAPFGDDEYAYLSADGGATWRFQRSMEDVEFNDRCGAGRRLSAELDGALYSVCDRTTFRSADGVSWTKQGEGAPDADMFFGGEGSLYAIDWRSSTGTGGTRATLFRSDDEGATWSPLATEFAIQTLPTVSNGRLIFADSRLFQFSGVRFSTDGGATLTEVALTVNTATATSSAYFAGIGYSNGGGTLFRSLDGGATWEDLVEAGALENGPTSLHAVGDLVVAVQIDGVSVSNDDGATWTTYSENWPTGFQTRGETAFVRDGNLYVQIAGSGLWKTAIDPVLVANEAPLASEAARITAAPNPSRGAATLRFETATPEAVRVQVVDRLGRVVLSLPERALAPGEHTIPLDLSRLSAGVYTAVVTSGESRRAARLTVVR
ncbi:T9SS type A sorting domain-containing protein [Rubricoccus marinus]|uniref:Secretion system C-terminal sorting domain-containing protein n=1 Tax=Rubricoccus marinus TaxID=716817 RepID=A0A259U1L4_9BACT|nr:T9SS type A sorting domain-containing protein [Rubricoccus marinus]OZC03933.1 hypothetical protein BSZ36_13655 [Rubricoccus marinus]